MKRKIPIENRIKIKQIILILIVILCMISLVSVFGRYAINRVNDSFLKSQEFYFNSDKLKETNVNYQVNNWSRCF